MKTFDYNGGLGVEMQCLQHGRSVLGNLAHHSSSSYILPNVVHLKDIQLVKDFLSKIV